MSVHYTAFKRQLLYVYEVVSVILPICREETGLEGLSDLPTPTSLTSSAARLASQFWAACWHTGGALITGPGGRSLPLLCAGNSTPVRKQWSVPSLTLPGFFFFFNTIYPWHYILDIFAYGPYPALEPEIREARSKTLPGLFTDVSCVPRTAPGP